MAKSGGKRPRQRSNRQTSRQQESGLPGRAGDKPHLVDNDPDLFPAELCRLWPVLLAACPDWRSWGDQSHACGTAVGAAQRLRHDRRCVVWLFCRPAQGAALASHGHVHDRRRRLLHLPTGRRWRDSIDGGPVPGRHLHPGFSLTLLGSAESDLERHDQCCGNRCDQCSGKSRRARFTRDDRPDAHTNGPRRYGHTQPGRGAGSCHSIGSLSSCAFGRRLRQTMKTISGEINKAPEAVTLIDAHHHLWDLSMARHPWLGDSPETGFFLGDYSALKHDYLPADYMKDASSHNVLATVHCEAEWNRADQVGETNWISAIHARHGFPNAIVAHAWFHTPNATDILEQQAAFPLVRGIRSKPATAASPAEKVTGGPGTMRDDKWLTGLS